MRRPIPDVDRATAHGLVDAGHTAWVSHAGQRADPARCAAGRPGHTDDCEPATGCSSSMPARTDSDASARVSIARCFVGHGLDTPFVTTRFDGAPAKGRDTFSDAGQMVIKCPCFLLSPLVIGRLQGPRRLSRSWTNCSQRIARFPQRRAKQNVIDAAVGDVCRRCRRCLCRRGEFARGKAPAAEALAANPDNAERPGRNGRPFAAASPPTASTASRSAT